MEYKDLPEGIQGPTDDFAFDLVVESAQATIARGGTVYQKFTCQGCGARLTMETPNQFYTKGSCEACGVTTDIKAKGCNFLAVFPLTEKGKEGLDKFNQAVGN